MRRPATTITEVLARLDEIIDATRAANNPAGYFTYVYRHTTAAVKRAIDAGRFEDNARMEAFDVAFANLYLDAWERHDCGERCGSAAWQLSFEATGQSKAIVQHVLLGMNAHINLDLGVAAGQLMAGKQLDELESDFLLVNDILQEIIDELQERISRVSPLFYLVDLICMNRDERLLDSSMRAARGQAWVVAHRVWSAGEDGAVLIDRIDGNVARFGNTIAAPRRRMPRWVWRSVAATESGDVGANIDRLL